MTATYLGKDRVPMHTRFRDRSEAGWRLGRALVHLREKDPVVLALARGGVPVAAEVAEALACPLEVINPRKIGHPSNPEYAIGAVTEDGPAVLGTEAATVDPRWLEQMVEQQRAEAQRRRLTYLGDGPGELLSGRTAVLVDDGLATGLTMRAAVRAVRAAGPRWLVVAVPVAPAETVAVLRAEVDEVVALQVPVPFLGAIGAYYDDFAQVEDAKVIEALARSRRSAGG